MAILLRFLDDSTDKASQKLKVGRPCPSVLLRVYTCGIVVALL